MSYAGQDAPLPYDAFGVPPTGGPMIDPKEYELAEPILREMIEALNEHQMLLIARVPVPMLKLALIETLVEGRWKEPT